MAFGYRYWMVYLPDLDPDSYLLFVHNPAGATKLRSYVSGNERVLGQPPLEKVFREAEIGVNRHEVDAHPTTDHGFWRQKTLEMNRRYLGVPSATTTGLVSGRAARGSQRQLQDYVNSEPATLSQAILQQMPAALREAGAAIRWVSPLARENYLEYRDSDFLARIGLADFASDLAAFWPQKGPSWDALGILSTPAGNRKPVVILVEAKSHIPEIYSSGCQAGTASLARIEAALDLARSWCGCASAEQWTGPLYQSANRIAHLYFLQQKLRVPAWLVNVYFTGDPIAPTAREQWELAVAHVKTQLGLTRPVPNMIEAYLPALEGAS